MNSYTKNEIITYGLMIAYIAFHPDIPSQLQPIVSHPVAKFLVAASIVYFSNISTTLSILIALIYITTYLSCVGQNEKFTSRFDTKNWDKARKYLMERQAQTEKVIQDIKSNNNELAKFTNQIKDRQPTAQEKTMIQSYNDKRKGLFEQLKPLIYRPKK